MKSIYGKYLRKAAFFWVGCFVVFLLVFLFVLVPQKKLREKANAEYVELKSQADIAYTAGLQRNKDRLNEQIENLVQRLRDFVIDSGSTPNLQFDISQISSDIGLNAFGISTTGKERIAAFDNCKYLFARRIQVSFSASFNKFAAFVNALEKHRPVIFINSFSITRSQQSDAGHRVDMELAVLVSKDTETEVAVR